MALGEAERAKLFSVGGWDKFPWIIPPPGFITVDRNNSLSLPAGLQEYQLENIEITTGYEGWLVAMGLQSSNFGVSFFTIKRALQPIRDYTRITVPLGQPETPATVFVKIEPNQPIALYATRTVAGPAVALRWRLFGWYYQV